ncbi:MAG: hypothetical protein ACE5HP_00125 [Gemmatimonadota bacterium]
MIAARPPSVRTLFASAGLVLLSGCAREAPPHSGPPGSVGIPGPDTVAGIVRQVGSTPFTRTIIQREEGAVGVTGALKREITRLAGATVRVSGEGSGEGPFGPELRVSWYEILSVDGERPYLGTLLRDEQGFRLAEETGRSIRLGVVPLRFDALVGGRVWVITDARGTVLRYGVLRAPEEMGGEEGRVNEESGE